MKPVLETIAQEIELTDPNWNVVDSEFSKSKKLFDYQVSALENAIKVLWKYYQDLNQDKQAFAKLYGDELCESLKITIRNEDYIELLEEFFSLDGNALPFSEICNRMSFWMATGSGKTLVIVKLIDILHTLMEMQAIPKGDILFLTYREDLISAFERHVEEFNEGKPLSKRIVIYSLKDYEERKSQRDFERRVFVYRADLISNESKEKIVNFRNYLEMENGKPVGKWYVILDEAHKGDKEESKKQHLFNILAQKGFLFNFSATFTQPIDIASTVYNFNLAEFIKEGYGKQIYVSETELKAFKEKDDFSQDAKRKIVLKTLLVLAGVKKAYESIKETDLYHNPLAIYLVNSVNTEDADLKLLFDELSKIAKGVRDEMFESLKEELYKELREGEYNIGEGKLQFFIEFIRSVSKGDFYRLVFNAHEGGSIEYVVNPENRQEIALKLDSGDRPFALIKIGDVSRWIKEKLEDYKEMETFREETFFETLNAKDSPINLLLGSRAFYEGWDSNRPTVITFINIGTGENARKFVLQSIGRGVRIEPVKNRRKRISYLTINDHALVDIANRQECKALESLFVFATNKSAVERIIEEIEITLKAKDFVRISLEKNKAVDSLELYVPVYREVSKDIRRENTGWKFRMSRANLELLRAYIDLMPVERFLVLHDVGLETYEKIEHVLNAHGDFVAEDESRNYRSVNILIRDLAGYVKAKFMEFDRFELIDRKIVHFEKVLVSKEYENELIKKIEEVQKADALSNQDLAHIIHRLRAHQLKELKYPKETFNDLILRKILQHYYIPLIYTDRDVDWIKHIVKTESEYKFIEALLDIADELDEMFDWWFFSKLDEHLDKEVYIPYLNGGKIAKFIPDFIFWCKKDMDYLIVFIDPKSKSYTDYETKVDGYASLFEENRNEKEFLHEDKRIKVRLRFYTGEIDNSVSRFYRKYWIDRHNLLSAFEW